MGGGTYDSSDRHRALDKNGHQQAQDNAIRNIQETLARWEIDFNKFRENDRALHSRLETKIADISNGVERKTYGARIIWSFVGLGIAIVMAFVGWMVARVEHQETRVDSIEISQVGLRETLQHVREDVREIRNRVMARKKE